MTHRKLFPAAAGWLLAAALAPAFAQERIDLDAIHKIKAEATQNSQVMEHLFYLTDVHGPRLTNSPGFLGAADWVVKQLQEWGIKAGLEKWGPFGRSWTFTHFSAHLIEPQYAPLIGFPLAWSSGTNGTVTAEAMLATLANDADLDKFQKEFKRLRNRSEQAAEKMEERSEKTGSG